MAVGLYIVIEDPGAGLPQFHPGSEKWIACNMDFKNDKVKMFNPNLFTITRTVAWPTQGAWSARDRRRSHPGRFPKTDPPPE